MRSGNSRFFLSLFFFLLFLVHRQGRFAFQGLGDADSREVDKCLDKVHNIRRRTALVVSQSSNYAMVANTGRVEACIRFDMDGDLSTTEAMVAQLVLEFDSFVAALLLPNDTFSFYLGMRDTMEVVDATVCSILFWAQRAKYLVACHKASKIQRQNLGRHLASVAQALFHGTAVPKTLLSQVSKNLRRRGTLVFPTMLAPFKGEWVTAPTSLHQPPQCFNPRCDISANIIPLANPQSRALFNVINSLSIVLEHFMEPHHHDFLHQNLTAVEAGQLLPTMVTCLAVYRQCLAESRENVNTDGLRAGYSPIRLDYRVDRLFRRFGVDLEGEGMFQPGPGFSVSSFAGALFMALDQAAPGADGEPEFKTGACQVFRHCSRHGLLFPTGDLDGPGSLFSLDTRIIDCLCMLFSFCFRLQHS